MKKPHYHARIAALVDRHGLPDCIALIGTNHQSRCLYLFGLDCDCDPDLKVVAIQKKGKPS